MANQIICILAETYGCEWAGVYMRLCCHLVTSRSLIITIVKGEVHPISSHS